MRKENEGEGEANLQEREKRKGPGRVLGGETETVNSRERGEDGSASKGLCFCGLVERRRRNLDTESLCAATSKRGWGKKSDPQTPTSIGIPHVQMFLQPEEKEMKANS